MKKTVYILVALLTLIACKNNSKSISDTTVKTETIYPSDVIPFMDEWKILLGDGTYTDSLVNYEKNHYYFTELCP